MLILKDKIFKKPFGAWLLENSRDSIIFCWEWMYGEDTSTSEIGQYHIIEYIKEQNGLPVMLKNGKKVIAHFGDYIIKLGKENFVVMDRKTVHKLFSF